MWKWVKKKILKSSIYEPENNYSPKRPLVWWIDDLSHRTCGLVDHPKVGLDKMPWPDCEEVYLAIDKSEYDKVVKILRQAKVYLEKTEIYDVEEFEKLQEIINSIKE